MKLTRLDPATDLQGEDILAGVQPSKAGVGDKGSRKFTLASLSAYFGGGGGGGGGYVDLDGGNAGGVTGSVTDLDGGTASG